MIGLDAAAVAAITGGQLGPGTDPRAPVGGVGIDTRTLEPGWIFAALPGGRVDGHNFVAAALAAGAPLALVSRPVDGPYIYVDDVTEAVGRLAAASLAGLRAAEATAGAPLDLVGPPGGSTSPGLAGSSGESGSRGLVGSSGGSTSPGLAGSPVRSRPRVLAVTGSVGKTTTKDLLGRICAAQGPTVVAAGSFNNHLGLPLTVLRAASSTDWLVLEMGANHVGEISHLANIAPPDVAIVLGVGLAHVGEFGSVEAITQAKSELVTGLKPAATSVAVLNTDDPRVADMAALAPSAAQVLSFGFGPQATIRGHQIELDDVGRLALTITDGRAGQTRRLATGLIGSHLAINVLAAVAAALAGGIGLDQAVRAAGGAQLESPHRMQVRTMPGGALVIDDAYNANPESMAAALRALADLASRTGRRPVAVLGTMLELGDSADAEHERIGRLAAQLGIAQLIGVGRAARPILDGAASAGMAPGDISWKADVAAVASIWHGTVSGSDIILIKGSHGSELWRLPERIEGLERSERDQRIERDEPVKQTEQASKPKQPERVGEA